MAPAKKVLITTDLSEKSAGAFAAGVEQAKNISGKAVVLYICEPFDLPPVIQKQIDSAEALQEMEQTYCKEQEEHLKKFITKNLGDAKDIETELIYSSESPSDEIIKYASEEDVAMIVMASQGKHSLNKWLVGSTAERVLCKATCPILLVPPSRDGAEDSK